MKLLFKRDEEGDSHPSPDQVSVGELVMNSVTGRLYTKLIDGSIVEWVAQSVCFDPVPTISISYEGALINNDVLENYCCTGGLLEFEVMGLKINPYEYAFEFVELTSNTNSQDINIQSPQYSNYTIPKPGSTTETINVRKALVPIELAILNSEQNISIFKFSVVSVTKNNKKLIEKIITIKCLESIL